MATQIRLRYRQHAPLRDRQWLARAVRFLITPVLLSLGGLVHGDGLYPIPLLTAGVIPCADTDGGQAHESDCADQNEILHACYPCHNLCTQP